MYIYIYISTGVFGQDALGFFYDLAQRSRCITHDPLTYLKLCQKLVFVCKIPMLYLLMAVVLCELNYYVMSFLLLFFSFCFLAAKIIMIYIKKNKK